MVFLLQEVMDTFKNRMGKLKALQQVTQLGLTERPQSWPQDILDEPAADAGHGAPGPAVRHLCLPPAAALAPAHMHHAPAPWAQHPGLAEVARHLCPRVAGLGPLQVEMVCQGLSASTQGALKGLALLAPPTSPDGHCSALPFLVHPWQPGDAHLLHTSLSHLQTGGL